MRKVYLFINSAPLALTFDLEASFFFFCLVASVGIVFFYFFWTPSTPLGREREFF